MSSEITFTNNVNSDVLREFKLVIKENVFTVIIYCFIKKNHGYFIKTLFRILSRCSQCYLK